MASGRPGRGTAEEGGCCWGVVLALILLPVVYVLSLGPVVYIVDRTGYEGEYSQDLSTSRWEWLAMNTR